MGKQLSKSEYASALGWNKDLVSVDEFILFYHGVYSLPVNKTMQKMRVYSNAETIEDTNAFSTLQDVDPEVKNKMLVIKRGAHAKRRKTNIRMKRRKFEHRTFRWRQVIQKRGNRAVRYDCKKIEYKVLHTFDSEYDTLVSWRAKEIARNDFATINYFETNVMW